MPSFAHLAAVTVACLACASAHAIPVTMSFTASGFVAGAPTDPVSGSFTYDSDSITSTINSLTSISLTIAGHAYTLSEVNFQSPWSGNRDIIYGSLGGLGITWGTDDFWLYFDRTTGANANFSYSWGGASALYATSQVSITRETGTQLPEPTSWALAALALTAALLSRRHAA